MPDPKWLGFFVSVGGQFYTGRLLFNSTKLALDWNSEAISIVITDHPSELLETIMNNTRRNTLLITVAATALVAGAGLASAQGMNERREAPAAAAHDQKAPEGKTD